jgi:hypothetical protein
MIRTVGRTVGLSLLYAAAVEFPLALCFWHVGIPAGRPNAPALLLAFSQLPGILVFDSLASGAGELPLEAAGDVLRPSLEHTGALALVNTVVLALLVYLVLRTAAAFAAHDLVEEDPLAPELAGPEPAAPELAA